MKQLKIVSPLFIFLIFARLLSSCCSDEGITSVNTFAMRFDDYLPIVKVELIGTNKTVFPGQSGQVDLTLNPADTISSYRVFYENTSGIVTIVYNRIVEYQNNDCNNHGLYVLYKGAHVANTTFKGASLSDEWFNEKTYVQITR